MAKHYEALVGRHIAGGTRQTVVYDADGPRLVIDTDEYTVTFMRRTWAWERTARDMSKKPRMYVDANWNESVWEQLSTRRNRPVAALRKAAVDALSKVDGLLFADQLTEGMRWSQRAGCSCPCSPGFILKGQTAVTFSWRDAEDVVNKVVWPHFDVWVHAKSSDIPATK